MKKIIKVIGLVVALLAVSHLGAQVSMYQVWNWAYPGPKFCNKETARIMEYSISNMSPDTINVTKIRISTIDTSYCIDSILLINSAQQQVVISKKPNQSNDSLIVNIQVLPWQNLYVELVVITKLLPVSTTYTFSTTDFDWELINGGSTNRTSFSSTISVTIQDCSPEFTLDTYSPYNTATACKNDTRYAQINIQRTVSGTKTIEWYLNDTLVKTSNGSMYSNHNFGIITLNLPNTEIKAVLTDMDGRTAQDSFVFNVIPNPVPKFTITKTTICTGESITLEVDTAGLSEWEFGLFGTQDSIFQFPITSGGAYGLFVTGKNGCQTGASINIVEFPVPIKPTIVFNDWVARATLQSDSFVWYWDSLPAPKMIPNSNSIFIDGSKPGYYQVKALNQYGCATFSDIEHYGGWKPADSLPKVKLLISSSKLGLTVCANDSIAASRSIYTATAPLLYERWYLNDSLLPFSPNQLHDNMWFKIPLNIQTVKLLVEIKDTLGFVGKDSIELTILRKPAMNFSLSGNGFCEGSYATAIAIGSGLQNWKWDNYEQNDTFIIRSAGVHSYTVVDTNGCINDTNFSIQMFLKPPISSLIFNEWIVSSGIQADSFAWFYSTDPSPTLIPNSNSIFTDAQKGGYYQVETFNDNKCSSKSNIYYYKGWIASDSLPKVKLLLSSPKIGHNVCHNDSVMTSRSIKTARVPLLYEKWYLNGTLLPFSPNQLFDGMWFKIPLNIQTVKLLVEIKDTLGFVGKDSLELKVFSPNKTSFLLSNPKFCEGSETMAIVDKFGIQSWKWDNWSKADTFVITTAGIHTYSIIDTNGCISDTSFLVTVLKKPERPTILVQDTLLWSDRQANIYEWYQGTNQTLFAGGQYTYVKTKGIYGLKITDSNGCTSDMSYVMFTYVVPPIINPNIKLVTPGNKTIYCEEVINISLLLDQIDKKDIQFISWFINGQYANYCSGGFCSLEDVPLKLVKGKNSILVQLTLKNGIMRTDVLEITAVQITKPKLDVSISNFCKGSDVKVRLSDSAIAYWPIVNISSSVINFKLTKEVKIYAVVTDNSCIAYSDTIILGPTEIPTPTLASIDCKIFATVGPDWSNGLFEWWNDTLLKSGPQKTYTIDQTGFYQARFIDNTSGCISQFSEPEFVEECKKTTGINSKEVSEIKIYPNPFNENLNVEIPTDCSIAIVNIVGQKIFESSERNLHLKLPPGYYILQIIKQGQVIGQEKIVSQ